MKTFFAAAWSGFAGLQAGLRDTFTFQTISIARATCFPAQFGILSAQSYRKKERYLSAVEFERLANVLSKREREGTEGPYAVAAIRLLALTGARLNEILTLRWDCVDFERQTLWLPDSKSGRKPVFLSQPAIEVLANLPRFDGNPFVIVGEKRGEHLKNLQKPWGRVRKAAGLHDVRIHDLRHSYASIAAAAGLSLPVIGRLLGHTKSVTTERYAHLAAEPLRAANEAVGERIAKLMSSSATRVD